MIYAVEDKECNVINALFNYIAYHHTITHAYSSFCSSNDVYRLGMQYIMSKDPMQPWDLKTVGLHIFDVNVAEFKHIVAYPAQRYPCVFCANSGSKSANGDMRCLEHKHTIAVLWY